MIYQIFTIGNENKIPINRKICTHAKDCVGNCVKEWPKYGRNSIQELFLMLIDYNFLDIVQGVINGEKIILEYDDHDNFSRIVPKIEFEKYIMLL